MQGWFVVQKSWFVLVVHQNSCASQNNLKTWVKESGVAKEFQKHFEKQMSEPIGSPQNIQPMVQPIGEQLSWKPPPQKKKNQEILLFWRSIEFPNWNLRHISLGVHEFETYQSRGSWIMIEHQTNKDYYLI